MMTARNERKYKKLFIKAAKFSDFLLWYIGVRHQLVLEELSMFIDSV